MEIETFLSQMCQKVFGVIKNNKSKDVQIIDAIGEVEINLVKYQVQIIFEPDESAWVSEDMTIIRKTIK